MIVVHACHGVHVPPRANSVESFLFESNSLKYQAF